MTVQILRPLLAFVAAGAMLSSSAHEVNEHSKSYSCGVVSLSVISQILSPPRLLSDVESLLPIDERDFASLNTLEKVARDLGYHARSFRSTYNSLVQLLAADNSAIVVHTRDFHGALHFSTVVAADQERILILDPPNEPEWQLREDFNRRWTGVGLLVSSNEIRGPSSINQSQSTTEREAASVAVRLGNVSRPQHLRFDRFEVTRAQYESFLTAIDDHGHAWCSNDEPPGKSHVPTLLSPKLRIRDPDYIEGKSDRAALRDKTAASLPVTGVDWFDAYSYSKWADCRLPTVSEWIAAASNGGSSKFPWGDEWTARHSNIKSSSVTRVGTFPLGASPDGILDLHGNVGEWAADFADGESVIVADILGSSYKSQVVRPVNFRTTTEKLLRSDAVGFRCVADLSPRPEGRDGNSPGAATLKEGLSVPNRTVDLGRIAAYSETSHRFTLRNDTQQEIVFYGLRSSCDCSEARLSTSSLSPGEQGFLEVKFSAGSDLGKRVSKIALRTNLEEQDQLEFTLASEVVASFDLSPRRLHFGRIYLGAMETSEFELIWPDGMGAATSEDEVHVSTTSSSLEVSESTGQGNQVPARYSKTFKVSFNPEAVGVTRLSEEILIGIDGALKTNIVLPVSARVDVGVEVDPEVLHFGLLSVGESATMEANISIREGVPVPEIAILATDTQVSASLVTTEDKRVLKLKARITPIQPGAFEDTIGLSIKHVAWDNDFTISVPVMAYSQEKTPSG